MQRTEPLDRKLADDACIVAVGILRLDEGLTVRRCPSRQRSAFALFGHRADSEEGVGAVRPGPEQAWAHGPTLIAWNIGPAIAVEIIHRLAAEASDRRDAPCVAHRYGCIAGDILAIAAGCVCNRVDLKFAAWPSRHQID